MVVLGVVFFILGVALCSLSGFLLVRDYVRRKREDKRAMDSERRFKELDERTEKKRWQNEVFKALEEAPRNHVCFYSDKDGSSITVEPVKKKPGPKPGVKRLGMKDCMPKNRGGRGKKKNTEEEQNGK